MISDDERRAVARRLRGNAAQDMAWLIPWAVFNDAEQHASEAVVRRLADLIEPTRNCSEPTRTCGECDRDALLALADYFSTPCNDIDCRRCPLVKWCEEGWDSGHPITCIECGQMHAADVIREALGVEP